MVKGLQREGRIVTEEDKREEDKGKYTRKTFLQGHWLKKKERS